MEYFAGLDVPVGHLDHPCILNRLLTQVVRSFFPSEVRACDAALVGDDVGSIAFLPDRNHIYMVSPRH